MNRSKIEFVDHTWNPITGCRHECAYCYAKKMTFRFAGDVKLNLMATKDYLTQDAPDGSGKIYVLKEPMRNGTGHPLIYPFGFEPTLHMYRMNALDKLKTGNNILVGAMADVFGPCIPDEWISEVLKTCVDNSMHNYLFLTKNPKRYTEYGVPAGMQNIWYGTTITKEEEMNRFNSLPAGCNTFVSMEPILEDLNPEHHNILFHQVDWVILGAETGNRKNKISPKTEWVEKILFHCEKFKLPVFMKDSMIPIVGAKNMRREFPTELMRKKQSQKVKTRLEGDCLQCKAHMKKNEMISLCARSQKGEPPKLFAFMCRKCFENFCNKNAIEIPKLAKFKEED